MNVTSGLVFAFFVIAAVSNNSLVEKTGSVIASLVFLFGFAKYHISEFKIVSCEAELRALESDYLQNEILPSLRPIAKETNRDFFRKVKKIRVYHSVLWATLAALVVYGIYKYWKG